MKLKTMSVTDLNVYIKRNFDHDFILSNLTVMGEISNFKAHSSGHLYFSLKDDQAKINGVMFRGDGATLKFMPKDGMKVAVKGRVSVYTKEGSYQLYAKEMEEVGLGELYVEFEKNKEKLFKEGLFDEDKKREIPAHPKKIAVITSPTGAAVRDIIQVIQKRNAGVSLVVYPALVQGEEARTSLINALNQVNKRKDIDVIILGRGGGSFEDLSCFNDLDLAYAISKSKIPVVTGIGHEVDFTIADFVADLRCATPSHAAEMTVPSKAEILRQIKDQENRLKVAYINEIRFRKSLLQGRFQTLKKNNPKILVANGYLEIDDKIKILNSMVTKKITQEKERLTACYGLLKAYNPLNVLDKGYALLYGENRKLITSLKDLDQEKRITVRLKDGEKVLEVNKDGNKEEYL